MRTKSTSPSGFLSLRAITILFGATAAYSILTVPLLAFLRPQEQATGSQRTLSFEERVSYQKAIEDVYWRHRIWPKERPDPKPSLDAVMSKAQLEKKVTDYLRNSQALEDYWQQPITVEQLQAEMDRMGKNTKQPEVLHELFEALGNDPFVIAECLARPGLAERLVTNCYAYDQRIHGELKERADAELQASRGRGIDQMKQLSGKYNEVEFVKSDGARQEGSRGNERAVKLNTGEWDQTVQKLGAIFNKARSQLTNGRKGSPGHPSVSARPAIAPYQNLPVGKLSPLQEDETRYYTTAIIEKTDGRLKLATVAWLKEPLEAWRARIENQAPHEMAALVGNYTLPKISAGAGCIDDTWTATSGPPDGYEGASSVWTGSEMIVWGGWLGGPSYVGTGGRYDPITDTWTPISTIDAPTSRSNHTAVWTGSEMIIWGGFNFGDGFLNTGGRYNPSTDSWVATSTTNAPAGREFHTAVWAGNEMIVWGGYDLFNNIYFNTGGKYNPDTDTWLATSTGNAPVGRAFHTAVWTGNEMIVWGGVDQNNSELNTGGRYNPTTNSWTATGTTNAPTGRDGHRTVWTGSEMIVWGGFDGNSNSNSGGRYNPITDTWIATSTSNAPSPREVHAAIWTGTEMIVWGGVDFLNYFTTGARYNPATNSWTATNTTNAPPGRAASTAVWTGSEMIVWGGDSSGGGRYNPSTDSWTIPSAPSGRFKNTAIWTGSEMIIWGGYGGAYNYLSTGARYNPTTDSWAATSDTNTLAGRESHTAVWTGSEMIVWGGWDTSSAFNTGGRYNPTADSWAATTTTSAPVARFTHTSVWAGGEMIVWGGEDNNFLVLNSGGRYNPNTDSWTTTSTTNAPSARSGHTAVWTGSEMIIWGGSDGNWLNTGGRYNPTANGWTATSIGNAPSGRNGHTAVWTGSEMIVWGGYAGDLSNTGGRYDPSTNTWTGTNTTGAPSGRESHTAVWTGSEMIIWGGGDSISFPPIDFNTGGRYNPGTDSWTATSTANAPAERDSHTAVWTGSEMIIWGGGKGFSGALSTGGRYCAQTGPTPTPTPTPTATATPRVTPRPRPTPHVRPTPPPVIQAIS